MRETSQQINKDKLQEMFKDLVLPEKDPEGNEEHKKKELPTSSASQTSLTSQAGSAGQKKQEPSAVRKKHTFNLTEAVVQDFAVLADGLGKKLEKYIDEVLLSVVEDNDELIAYLKRHRKK